MSDEEQMTVKDVARVLRCHPASVYRLRGLRFRTIPGVGRRYDAKEFRIWLQSHEQRAQIGRKDAA